MATYTVIQDIEAEDKLLGPLTLRQFIYACIMIGSLFLAFMVAKANIFLAIPFLLPAGVFGFLAAPFKQDQPTETWAVAKIRFLFKPRKRIWDQSGQKDLVTVTAPKQEVINYTDGLSQHDVRSRLQALASTIDSRGWAVKNATGGSGVAVALPTVFAGGTDTDTTSDRLTGGVTLPSAVPEFDQTGAAPVDVLDETTGVAQQFDQMIAAAGQAHRQQIIDKLNNPQPEPTAAPQSAGDASTWFTPTPPQSSSAVPDYSDQAAPVAPVPAAPSVSPQDEAALLAELDAHKLPDEPNIPGNMKVIQPLSDAPQVPTATDSLVPTDAPAQSIAASGATPVTPNPPVANPVTAAPVTAAPDPAILDLSRNDDLDVATIARQAKKQSNTDEVVISLH